MPQTFVKMIAAALASGIDEIFPWDVEAYRANHPDTLLLDIREPDEFATACIAKSLHVPRGILEQACDWGYAETIPELANARQRPVIVICRSGNRSVLGALTMKQLGYQKLLSLKTGIKGWNDADLPLINHHGGSVDPDWVDAWVNPPVRDEQLASNAAVAQTAD